MSFLCSTPRRSPLISTQYPLSLEGVSPLLAHTTRTSLIDVSTCGSTMTRDASYYNVTINGKTEVNDVAWYYPETFDKANHIKGYIAFYKVFFCALVVLCKDNSPNILSGRTRSRSKSERQACRNIVGRESARVYNVNKPLLYDILSTEVIACHW